ncbi:MAG: DNA repair protein RadC [Rickettsiales bacterium]|jgi:DNA repair protein RadC|nr:DNA repair protein RadC [Rickettsiales bacterium]
MKIDLGGNENGRKKMKPDGGKAKPGGENGPENINAGHRERMRKRLFSSPESLADYEILEMLLANAIPRRDVKPFAKALIAKHGNLAEIANATPHELMKTPGIGESAAAAIKTAHAAMTAVLRIRAERGNIIANWNDLTDYVRAKIGGKPAEEFHVLYLDSKCRLIKDETHSTGTLNHASVYPREIVKRVLELGAASAIIAHNHPTGDCTPSKADIEITRKVAESLESIDAVLHDHIIAAKGHVLSFKQMGLI